MQPPQDHDGFFSFTVPPKCPPALSHHHLHPHSHHHLSPILTNTPSVSLNPLFIDLDSRSPSGDSSISPRSASTHHRPSTAGPFAYNLPTNLSPSDPRPTSSAGLSLQQTTPPQPRPLARLSLSNLPTTASVQLQSAPPPFQYGIGPHNTRPMTAPGAGWEAGQFNHDYDYGSASVGLFRNPQCSPAFAANPQQLSSPDPGTTLSDPTRFTPGPEPARTSPSLQSLYSTYRPSTHAGTQLGFGERPTSGYGGGGYGLSQASTGTWPSSLETPSAPSSSSSCASSSAALKPAYSPVSRLSYDLIAHHHSALPMASLRTDQPGYEHDQRLYHFNLLPGAPRKRARRRFDEVERLYGCNYPGCTKAYGTLNHLNAHITMQKHGLKRMPQEFKEIRKEWRARKKAEAEARTANLKHYAGGAGGGPPHLGAMPSKTTIPTTTTTTPTSSTISQALHPSSNHHLLMNSYRDHHHDPWKLAA